MRERSIFSWLASQLHVERSLSSSLFTRMFKCMDCIIAVLLLFLFWWFTYCISPHTCVHVHVCGEMHCTCTSTLYMCTVHVYMYIHLYMHVHQLTRLQCTHDVEYACETYSRTGSTLLDSIAIVYPFIISTILNRVTTPTDAIGEVRLKGEGGNVWV